MSTSFANRKLGNWEIRKLGNYCSPISQFPNFLIFLLLVFIAGCHRPSLAPAASDAPPPVRFVDVTAQAGIHFRHDNGASGKKWLPETMGSGCAFLDYDNDGWLDILFVNGKPLNVDRSERSTVVLYRNNRNGTFTDATHDVGLRVDLYGMGVAVGDYDNDGFDDVYVTGLGGGRLLRNLREHDRIVGGIDPVSTQRAVELYSPILTAGRVIPMTATAAEVTKTAENTFRDLQIAAINELALYCEAMGINVYDVRAGIDSLKGDGITRAVLHPGAGVGGHCLTKDTYHLERGARTSGGPLDYPEGRESLFTLARAINDFMPRHMFTLTAEALARIGKRPATSRVALLGWAFIRNSDDARNTPAEPYRDLLLDAGALNRRDACLRALGPAAERREASRETRSARET